MGEKHLTVVIRKQLLNSIADRISGDYRYGPLTWSSGRLAR